MNLKNINWTTMIVSVIGVLNGAALQFGIYHLNNEQLYSIDQTVTVLVTLVGAVYHNRKNIVPVNPATGAK